LYDLYQQKERATQERNEAALARINAAIDNLLTQIQDIHRLPNRPNAPRNGEVNARVGTCFDLVEFDDVQAKEYLQENKNHILLVQPDKILCMNRNELPVQRFYKCRDATGNYGPDHVIRTKKYAKVGEQNYVITERDLLSMRNPKYDVFILHPTETTVPALVRFDLVHIASTTISADHCSQPYPLYRLEALSLEQYLAREGGRRRARKQTHRKKMRTHGTKMRNRTRHATKQVRKAKTRKGASKRYMRNKKTRKASRRS